MVAAELGLIDAIDILLRKHADINAIDFYHGQTALMLAILSNQDKVFIRQLIRRGANPHLFSTEEYNAIMYAVRQKNIDVVTVLIHEGCLFKHIHNRFNQYALTIAVKQENHLMIDLLLRHGAGVNHVAVYGAFEIIVFYRHLTSLNMMLESGIDPNMILHDHTPLLHSIIKKQWIDGLTLLLTRDVNVNLSYGKETPLHCAIDVKSVIMMDMLLKAGANINIVPSGGYPYEYGSPLAYACRSSDNIEEANFLMLNGANVNQKINGKTILMIAILYGNCSILPSLILNGATISCTLQMLDCLDRIQCQNISHFISTRQTVLDMILSHESIPNNVLSNLFRVRRMVHSVWTKLLPFETKQTLQTMIQHNLKDQLACYTALHEGEDAVLTKFRQGEEVDFSQSMLRGIMRPMGNRHLRKLLVSYLIHPKKTRSLLSTLQVI
jgi:ankyrin repeat protein